jgi:polyisoprenoid-binding protein YceI
MKTLNYLVLAAALAVAPACKKKKTETPAPTPSGSAMMGSGSSMTPPPPDPNMGSGSGSAAAGSGSGYMGSGSAAAGSGSAAMVDPNADYIDVFAEHAPEKKPDDPVKVHFEKFAVKKVDFKDPTNLEGGSASIEVDLTSLKSGSDKRDKHLATDQYLDASKVTTMTIDIGKVKKKADKQYTAEAKVKLRGVNKTYAVTFEVVDAKDDWIRIKGEHKFARLDFKVGKPKIGADEAVGQDLTVKLQLTLKKT